MVPVFFIHKVDIRACNQHKALRKTKKRPFPSTETIVINFKEQNCIACGTCIDECPVEAISEGDKYSINPDLCTECGTCADACPSEAIHLG